MSDGKIIIDTLLDDTGISKGVENIKGKLGSLAKGGLEAFTGAIVAASTALATAAGASVKLASDLTEVQNVVDVTFGDNASKINDWAKSAATSFGMSELQAKQFNGTMGAMLKSMGLTSDQTLDMSENMTGLAGDFASFYNLDPTEAFEKIRSGISGETEPLKQLGINMSIANLNAFALSSGLNKTYDSMTQSEQATLRYNYLMNVSKDAQGDFARTSTSLANQVRIGKLAIQDLGSTIGTTLIPMAQDAIKELNGFTGELKTAFNDGGFDELASKIGDVFAKIINDIAQQAPKFIDLGVAIIENLIEGLDENIDQIGKSGVTVLKSFISGAETIIPEVAKLGIDVISSLVEGIFDHDVSNDTKRLLSNLVDAFKNVIESLITIAKTVLPPIIKLMANISDNLKILVPLITAGYVAFKAWAIISVITKAMEGYTVATKLAALATAALNTVTKANLLLLVAGALATLVAGIGTYLAISDKTKTKTDELSNSIDKQATAYREAKTAQQEKIESGLSEISHVQDLWAELQKITDENGNVKESDKARAQFILNELNTALDTEMSMTDGVINKYGELKSSIDELILKKKAMIVLESQEDNYRTALKNKVQAEKDSFDARAALSQAEMDMKAKETQINESTSLIEKARLGKELIDLQGNLNDKRAAYSESQNTLNGYYKDIDSYETNSQRVIQGGADNYKAVLDSMGLSFRTYGNATETELKNQVTNFDNYVDNLERRVANGEKIDQSIIDNAKRQAELARTEYEKVGNQGVTGTEQGINGKAPELNQTVAGVISGANTAGVAKANEATGVGQNIINSAIAGANSASPGLSQSVSNSVDNSLSSASSKEGQFNSQGSSYISFMANGAYSRAPDLSGALSSITSSGVTSAQNAGSSTSSIGSNIVNGIISGVKSRGSTLLSIMSKMALGTVGAVTEALNIQSPSRVFRDIVGKNIVKGVEVGVEMESPNLNKQLKDSFSKLKDTDISSLVAQLQATVNHEIAITTSGVIATRNNIIGVSNSAQDTKTSDNKAPTVIAKLVVDGKEFTQTVVAPNQQVLTDYYKGR